MDHILERNAKIQELNLILYSQKARLSEIGDPELKIQLKDSIEKFEITFDNYIKNLIEQLKTILT